MSAKPHLYSRIALVLIISILSASISQSLGQPASFVNQRTLSSYSTSPSVSSPLAIEEDSDEDHHQYVCWLDIECGFNQSKFYVAPPLRFAQQVDSFVLPFLLFGEISAQAP
jgi:hypothetical protein